MMPHNERAPRDTVRPFSPAVGAARPHGVPTPTSFVRYVPDAGEYLICNKSIYNSQFVGRQQSAVV